MISLDKIKETWARKRGMLWPLIIIFVILLEYFLIINPSRQASHELALKCQEIKTQVASNEAMSKSSEDNAHKISLAEESLSPLRSSLIEKNREIEFVTYLEKLAYDRKVEQQAAIGPLKEEKGKLYKSATLDINALGSYENIIDYLRDIENLSYLSSISSLSLSRSNTTEKGGDNSLHLIINTYWR